MTWHSDGYDRYVGLWEVMADSGVPVKQIHEHLNDIVARLEERVEVLERTRTDRQEELREIRLAIESIQRHHSGGALWPSIPRRRPVASSSPTE